MATKETTGVLLSGSERAALLKVRTAGRFDYGPRGTGGRGEFTAEEAQEEGRAATVTVPRIVFEDLAVRGLIEGWPRRLTDLGRAALAATPAATPEKAAGLCIQCGLQPDAPIHTGGHPTRCHAPVTRAAATPEKAGGGR